MAKYTVNGSNPPNPPLAPSPPFGASSYFPLAALLLVLSAYISGHQKRIGFRGPACVGGVASRTARRVDL